MPGNVPGNFLIERCVMTTLSLTSLHNFRRLLVAFSGGLDSTVLLHALAHLREADPSLDLRAIHVHHGISLHADSWVAHCERVCETLNVPLTVRRVQLAQEGLGLEGQARKARYAAFANALRPDEALVTAQHQDDQCETVLLALKRGSGPAGLAAMPEKLAFAGTFILRPLLHLSRAQLEQYAQAQHLAWIEDESNQDDSYDRNFLRLRVLPQLTSRWPHFAEAAARSAQLCGEQEQLLDELLSEELTSLTGEQGELRLAPLSGMSDNRRGALLRRWLASHGAQMPSRAALQRLWSEVAQSREDACPRLRFGDHEARRYQEALWWVRLCPGQGDRVIFWENLAKPLALPDGLGQLIVGEQGARVRMPAADERVTVRFRAQGLLHIVGRERGRSLKKLWQELRIPPWRRDTTPLIFYGEQLICAPGIFVTREGMAQGETGWHIDWRKEQNE